MVVSYVHPEDDKNKTYFIKIITLSSRVIKKTVKTDNRS